jgi:hypothetical protein
MANALVLACLQLLVATPLAVDDTNAAGALQEDFVILRDQRPKNSLDGRLVFEAQFGQVGSSAPEYSIGSVRDLAVSKNGMVYILDNPSVAGIYTLRA